MTNYFDDIILIEYFFVARVLFIRCRAKCCMIGVPNFTVLVETSQCGAF